MPVEPEPEKGIQHNYFATPLPRMLRCSVWAIPSGKRERCCKPLMFSLANVHTLGTGGLARNE